MACRFKESGGAGSRCPQSWQVDAVWRNYSREISPGVYRAGTRSVVKLSIFTPHMTLVTLSIPLVGFTYLLRPDTQVSLVYASLSIVQCQ